MTTQVEHAAALNSLLRGELSAIESYEYALNRFEGESQEFALHRIAKNHRHAAAALRWQVLAQGGEPTRESRPWEYFNSIKPGTPASERFRDVLVALRRGEEYAMEAVKETANSELPSEDCFRMLVDQLLPQTRAHLSALEHLTRSVG